MILFIEKIPQGHSGICLTTPRGDVSMYEFGRYDKEEDYRESDCGGEPRIQFGSGLWVDAIVKKTNLGRFRLETIVDEDGNINTNIPRTGSVLPSG